MNPATPLSDQREKLAALRQQLAGRLVPAIQSAGGEMSSPSTLKASLPLGLAAIDAYLGGGLMQGALHEIAGAGSDMELATLPAFFACQMLLQHPTLRVIWIAPQADLYGPGLLAQGLAPTRLLMAETHQDAESLWAVEEAARSGAVSLVIGEIDLLDLTASRRLQLAAEETGCTILALRRSRLAGKGDKHRQPSAALTRWLITPCTSDSIADQQSIEARRRPGLGLPAWHLHLWRQRNGPPASWNIALQQNRWQQLALSPIRQTAIAANDDTRSRSLQPSRAITA